VGKVGKVAYRLGLPPELTGVHPVFHVSQLRKCVVVEKRVPAQALDVQETLEYLEYPVWILDWAKKSTRNTTTRFCKVLWSNHSEREATWEKESALRANYPHLFEAEVTS
jgi:phosphoenolpyruvate carboxylase